MAVNFLDVAAAYSDSVVAFVRFVDDQKSQGIESIPLNHPVVRELINLKFAVSCFSYDRKKTINV